MASMQNQIALNVTRERVGWEAEGTANVLDTIDHNFGSLLEAQKIGALHDRELDHVEKARDEVRKAAKRLHVIAKRCERGRYDD